MQQYLDLMQDVLLTGTKKEDRTGTGTISVFGRQMRFDLQKGFPLVTTKKVHMKSIIHELLWFISGSTNIKYLQDNGVKIWNEWADEKGDLGPVYGSQWRSWTVYREETIKAGKGSLFEDINLVHKESIDQISNLINTLRNNPDSRRIIVSAWNVAEIENMKLPPCHAFFQFYSREMTLAERLRYSWKHNLGDFLGSSCDARGWVPEDWAGNGEKIHIYMDGVGIPRRILSCQLYQRSADLFLGVPFNIASYALLVLMVAQVTNHVAGEFIWTGGDTHLYLNHLEQAQTQLQREPLPLPNLVIKRKPESIFDFVYEDFELVGYQSHPAIKAPVAV